MVECNYLIFWRLVVILIVEGGGPPQSDRSKGETGSCCKSMHFSLFLFSGYRPLCFFGGSQCVLSSAMSHSCSRAVIQWLGGAFVVTFILRMSVVSC